MKNIINHGSSDVQVLILMTGAQLEQLEEFLDLASQHISEYCGSREDVAEPHNFLKSITVRKLSSQEFEIYSSNRP